MSQTPHDESAAELAALYVSGAMTDDERVSFESELIRGNESYRDEVARLEEVVLSLIETIEPVAPSDQTRSTVMAMTEPDRSGNAIGDQKPQQIWREWGTDQAEFELFTMPATAGEWESTGIEGIEVRRLFVDKPNNRMTAMFRMVPGTAYVPHVHDGAEECYVLEGDLHVGDDIVMHAGDYQRAPAGSQHGVQRTEGGCLLLISSSLDDELI